MDNKIFIYLGLILLVFYLARPVPYCKIIEEEIFVSEALYTSEETLEIKEITAVVLNVKGTSMVPTIQDNSGCLCVKKENYIVGDIVFFFAEINGQFHGITHRIVSIEGDKYYTRGDGNDFTDPPMTEKSIVCAIPYVKRYQTLT